SGLVGRLPAGAERWPQVDGPEGESKDHRRSTVVRLCGDHTGERFSGMSPRHSSQILRGRPDVGALVRLTAGETPAPPGSLDGRSVGKDLVWPGCRIGLFINVQYDTWAENILNRRTNAIQVEARAPQAQVERAIGVLAELVLGQRQRI